MDFSSQCFAGRSAKIDYPCVWQYKVIGTNQQILQKAISERLGDIPYSLSASRSSRSKKYCSMSLEVAVENDAQRQAFYHALSEHPEIKAVL